MLQLAFGPSIMLAQWCQRFMQDGHGFDQFPLCQARRDNLNAQGTSNILSTIDLCPMFAIDLIPAIDGPRCRHIAVEIVRTEVGDWENAC